MRDMPKIEPRRRSAAPLPPVRLPCAFLVFFALCVLLADCSALFPLESARRAKAEAQVGSVAMAVDMYLLDCGRIPTADQGLAALFRKPSKEPVPDGWKGPYAEEKTLRDPWGRPLEYLVPGGDGSVFGIRCLGADGAPGGTGRDRDFVSWDLRKRTGP